MINIIKRHLPSTKSKWKAYIWITLPVMFSALIFSLNSFVDNFMVGSIIGGAAALSAANTLTAILFGAYAAICTTASIFFAQYYNSGDFKNAKRVQRLRILLCVFVGLIFSLFAIIDPEILIKLILGTQNSNTWGYKNILNKGSEYLRVIAVTWLFVSISLPASLSLSETGRGKLVLYVASAGLIINIISNYLLINNKHVYQFGLGVKGAAYSTLLSKIITFSSYQLIIFYLRVELFINPFRIFKIKKTILKQYFKRSFFLIFSAFTFILIEIRVPMFSRAYPIGSIGQDAGAMNVFALTFAIMNIFLTTFSAISANAANFIGKELGKGNLEQAKQNSDELKGFNTIISISLSLLFFSITFAIPHLSFLASNEPAKGIILRNVMYTSWVICFMYPIWVWLESSRINSLSGGKVNIQTCIDFGYGIFQLLYLVLLVYWAIPTFKIPLYISFLIFSLSDIVLLIAFEINYHKLKWNVNITKEYSQSEIDVSKDNYKVHISHE